MKAIVSAVAVVVSACHRVCFGDELQDLIDQRVKLVKEAGEFLTKCESESGGLSKEQAAQFAKMHADADKLKAQIDDIEKGQKSKAERALLQQRAEEELAKAEQTGILPKEELLRLRQMVKEPEKVLTIAQATETVVDAWCRGGQGALADKDIQAAMRVAGCSWKEGEGEVPAGLSINLSARAPRNIEQVVAAQGTNVAGGGGETVPEGFLANLEAARLRYGGVRELATIIRTSRGNDLPMPNYNDTGNLGARIGENVEDSEQDIAFTSTTLKAYLYTSKIIRVSKVLEQDSAFNMGTEIGMACGVRLGRIHNREATIGTGTDQPMGYVTGSILGVSGDITYDTLMDLKHSVDPDYRDGGMGSWSFSDAALLLIKKIKDNDGQPLFRPGMSAGVPDRIDGDRYAINQDVPAPAAGARSIIYGDHSQIYCREVLDVTLVRLVERYAEFHQTGYVAIMRFDSRVRNAGTNPLKHLAQAPAA